MSTRLRTRTLGTTARIVAAAVVSGAVVSGALVSVGPAAARSLGADAPVSDPSTSTFRDPALADADTTRVTGTLTRVEDGTDRRVIVADDGAVIPVAVPDELADGTVRAELVDGSTLDAVLAGDSPATVRVESAAVTQQAVAAPIAHRAYVVRVTNSGPVDGADVVNPRVQAGLDYWRTEAALPGATIARSVSMTSSAADPCGLSSPSQVWNEARQVALGGAALQPGDHVVVVVDDACPGAAGVGTVGQSGLSSSGYLTVTDDPSIFTATFAHELGHNVGLSHADLATGATTVQEYGDRYSVMGFAIVGYPPPALDSAYRNQLGLTTSAEVATVDLSTTSTWSGRIVGRGLSSGLRALRLVSGGVDQWVELRDRLGRDVGAAYGRSSTFPTGVTVTSWRGGDPRDDLVLRPPSSSRAAYRAGDTFTVGPATVRIDAIDGSGALVSVSGGSGSTPTTPAPTSPAPTTPAPTTPAPTTPAPTTPAPTTPVVASSVPTVVGTAAVGRTLTARPGTWQSGASLSYQWLVDGRVVLGAYASTWKVPSWALGRRVSVQVTGRLPGYTSVTRTSAATGVVVRGSFSVTSPSVRGARVVGRTLTASVASWSPGARLSYRWYADGRVLRTTTRTLKIPSSLRGKRIKVRITGTATGFVTRSVTTRATAPIR